MKDPKDVVFWRKLLSAALLPCVFVSILLFAAALFYCRFWHWLARRADGRKGLMTFDDWVETYL